MGVSFKCQSLWKNDIFVILPAMVVYWQEEELTFGLGWLFWSVEINLLYGELG